MLHIPNDKSKQLHFFLVIFFLHVQYGMSTQDPPNSKSSLIFIFSQICFLRNRKRVLKAIDTHIVYVNLK